MPEPPSLNCLMNELKSEALRFRVTKDEKAGLKKLVDSINRTLPDNQKINTNQLLQVIVRNSIELGPAFLTHELSVLKETNRYLLGIGRNINQIVKKINSGELNAVRALDDKYLRTIGAYIVESRNQIDTIVRVNHRRGQIRSLTNQN